MRNSRALRWRKFPTTRPDRVARSPENLSRGMRRAMQRRSNNPQEYGAGRVADVAFPFLVATRSAGEPTIVGNSAAKRKPALFSRFRVRYLDTCRHRYGPSGFPHPVAGHSNSFLSLFTGGRRPAIPRTMMQSAGQPKECPQCSHGWWPQSFARCDRRARNQFSDLKFDLQRKGGRA